MQESKQVTIKSEAEAICRWYRGTFLALLHTQASPNRQDKSFGSEPIVTIVSTLKLHGANGDMYGDAATAH